MRAIWKGTIGFGLVNIPVKLYSATQQSTLDLDMVDKRDHEKIHFQRVNEKTGKEVKWENIAKAYLINDEYVVLDEEDFLKAAPEKSKIIKINHFVNESEIDTIFYENSYTWSLKNRVQRLMRCSAKPCKSRARWVLRSLCCALPKIYASSNPWTMCWY